MVAQTYWAQTRSVDTLNVSRTAVTARNANVNLLIYSVVSG